jgi:diaminopimelate decarboxylase
MTNRPTHAVGEHRFEYGELLIGALPVTELAARAGRTPFYAYDRLALDRRVAQWRAAMPPRLHLHYAIKANPMPALVAHMGSLTDGFDVASLGELRIALDTGMAANRISFAGPGKTDDELRAAVAAGITINLESAGELERITAIGAAMRLVPQVAVRVNPDFELKSSGMKMSGGPKPFGVDAEQVPDLLARIGVLPVRFRGLHIFAGSQNLRAEAIIEAHTQTLALAERLAEAAPSPVTHINIGGGLGIPYFPGEQPLDLAPIAANLLQRISALSTSLRDAEIVMELGRYLVGPAGVYVCRVIDRKVSRGRTYLVTDGGLHHHLAASGNFGQVIRKNYPIAVAARASRDEDREEVTIVGPLCTPLDLLAERVELPRCAPGDLIALFQSGAYGFSASPQRFLSHPPPAEMLVGGTDTTPNTYSCTRSC